MGDTDRDIVLWLCLGDLRFNVYTVVMVLHVLQKEKPLCPDRSPSGGRSGLFLMPIFFQLFGFAHFKMQINEKATRTKSKNS